MVRVGDNSAASALATINQVDPIYVAFAVPQVFLPEIRSAMAKGDVKVVALIDENRKQSGAIAFLENNVDPLTGTVTAKARIGNANEGLWPGQFVKVEIILGIEPEAISVPAPAIQLGAAGALPVRRQGRRRRTAPVEIKRTQNGESVIGKGLQPGEQVVGRRPASPGQRRQRDHQAGDARSLDRSGAAARLVSGEAGSDMLSALCIRRPVMTILVMASFVIAGAFGYKQLPVAAVPRVEFPTIQVTAQLPGASPETMAASVASILERQFSTIAGVTTMTSTSSLGNTSIVLQFDLNRSIDGAALDVQSAISSAMRRLPAELHDAAQLPQDQSGGLRR